MYNNNNVYYYLIDIEGKICGIIDSNNQFEGRYEYWQMTSSGKVPGINGNVDIDIMYINK